MKLNWKILLLTLSVFLTFSVAYAFQEATSSKGFISIEDGGNGGNNGGTGGTTTGGTTTGGTTTGGTTNGGTGGTTTGGTTTGGTTTGGTTTGGTTNGGTGGTTGGDVGCTRTQGYWGSSPAGQQRLIELVGVGGLELGNVTYSAAELDDILDTNAGGNALMSLAHQLIAAKLNVLNGASGSEISDEIDAADALIGNLVVGTDSVAPASALGQQMLAVKDELDDYNNGGLNVPHCTRRF